MSLRKVYKQKPLVHCLTNYVVANFTANGLLAVGASPVMADAIEEAAEMAGQANALLLNIGTLNDRTVRSMIAAGNRANDKQIPVVLDPVGAGATTYRTHTVFELLQQIKMDLIRCNYGELAAIAQLDWQSKGVDSGTGQFNIEQTAMAVATQYDCIIVATGEIDVITDGKQLIKIEGGHAKITQITGMGCLLSALVAALLGSGPIALADIADLLKEYKQLARNAAAPLGKMQANLLDELEKMAVAD